MAQLAGSLKQSFTDATGAPLVGGKLYTYQAGTSTPLSTFTDQTETAQNTNPIILDSRGECDVWLGTNSYKFVLKDANDNVIWTVDNVSYLPDGSVTAQKLAANAITTSNLPNLGVTNSKLADASVSTAKIQDLAISTGKIADGAVTTSKIADSNVTTGKIADANVTTTKIADANVTTAKLAGSAVTLPKTPILGIATASLSNTSTSSSTYTTLASVSFTTSGGYISVILYSSNIGSQLDGYLKLSAADVGASPRQITVTGNLTVDYLSAGFPFYIENTIGFELVTGSVSGTFAHKYPPGAFFFNLGNMTAGTYTVNLKWKTSATGGSITPTLSTNNLYMMVREQLARYS